MYSNQSLFYSFTFCPGCVEVAQILNNISHTFSQTLMLETFQIIFYKPVHQQIEKDWKKWWLAQNNYGVCGRGQIKFSEGGMVPCPTSHTFGASSAAVSDWHTGRNVPPLSWNSSIALEWSSEQKPHLGEDGCRRPEQTKIHCTRMDLVVSLITGALKETFSWLFHL